MTRRMRFAVSILVLVVACAAVVFSSITPSTEALVGNGKSRPDIALVERFDGAIQQRFLMKPQLGIYRITPKFVPSPHLGEEFYPDRGEETDLVERFSKDGWKVNLYLFGRRSVRKTNNGVVDEKFTTTYRTNPPVKITRNVDVYTLAKPDTLLHRVRDAFDAFQFADKGKDPDVQFESAGWSYVAKPVRASSENCLACHVDFVSTKTKTNSQPTFRQRKVGDVNGVILYGFRKE